MLDSLSCSYHFLLILATRLMSSLTAYVFSEADTAYPSRTPRFVFCTICGVRVAHLSSFLYCLSSFCTKCCSCLWIFYFWLRLPFFIMVMYTDIRFWTKFYFWRMVNYYLPCLVLIVYRVWVFISQIIYRNYFQLLLNWIW
jgi:hypothetical protein